MIGRADRCPAKRKRTETGVLVRVSPDSVIACSALGNALHSKPADSQGVSDESWAFGAWTHTTGIDDSRSKALAASTAAGAQMPLSRRMAAKVKRPRNIGVHLSSGGSPILLPATQESRELQTGPLIGGLTPRGLLIIVSCFRGTNCDKPGSTRLHKLFS